MPSAEMRRSTRVMVVKGGGEGARVLRSGRRLWPDFGDGGRICKASSNGGDWLDMIQGSKDRALFPNFKANGWRRTGLEELEIIPMVIDAELSSPDPLKISLGADRRAGKIWGSVYQRKRKRFGVVNSDGSGNLVNNRNSEDRMYGKYYVRRQRRKTTVLVERSRVAVAAVVDSSRFVRFLGSVLGYMMRARVRLRELSAFLITGAVHEVFSSHGIHFSRAPPTFGIGICKFFGVVGFVPLFSVDFSAVSSTFFYMQLDMLLRSRCLPSTVMKLKKEMDTDDDNHDGLSCIYWDRDLCGSEGLTSGKVDPGKGSVLCPTNPATKVPARKRRNGLNSISFHTKRRSMRPTRVRNSLSLFLHKADEDLVPSLFRLRSHASPLSPVVSDRHLRSSVRKSIPRNIKEVKSTLVGMREDIDSTCCSANLLIFESDRCYREEGVNILLEFSASKQWVLAIKRDGSLRYSHVARNIMRPCASNRFTHDIIWTSEDGWKLEFPNRGDWFIFKELYKECCDRNGQASTIKVIPVPGVWKVPGYDNSNSASFFRPDSYIVINDDELSRAMGKRTANYDIDSDDDEWLNKFNNSMPPENEVQERVTEETFELMVDAFEKAHFGSPDDYSDEKSAIDNCLGLARREVVEAVYRYWMMKRKQKCSGLIRIFQCHRPRRTELTPKSVLRKKRSFKRQASQAGRGKQRILLQAFAAEQDALEEKSTMLRIEAAKNSANRSMEMAVQARKRAQALMENADLFVYKATMAHRIAEAAWIADSMTDSSAAGAYLVD